MTERMLTQIYEISSRAEAAALSAIGIDHVGLLLGKGEFPRELCLAAATEIAAAIRPPSKLSALFLTADLRLVEAWAGRLRPPILHLGAAAELLSAADLTALKAKLPQSAIMRSVPVSGAESVAIAESYRAIADFLLLDSHRPSDRQIGALGVTHDWSISRRIVELADMPVILAGGLGPENVAEAIKTVRPAGVDSKTRTDREGSHIKDLERVRRFHHAARRAAMELRAGRDALPP